MKKHRFIQHVPSFVDIPRDEYIEFDFDTVEELLNHEYVNRFRVREEEICRFEKSVISYVENTCHLMQIYDGGYAWWVVGTITNQSELDLPIWEAKYRETVPKPKSPTTKDFLVMISKSATRLSEKIENGDLSSFQAIDVFDNVLLNPTKDLEELINSLGYSKLG
jgi:hypothetical protein